MKVQFRVSKITNEETYSVAKLESSLTDIRNGDSVAGEIFLTTAIGNEVFKMGDSVEIELVPVEVIEETVEEPIV